MTQQIGRVLDQFPPPGSEVEPGSPVTITVGKRAAQGEGEVEARMRVAVLSGGRSSEHDVSLRSGEAVARGLEQAGHEALRVTIAREGGWSRGGAPLELTPAAGLLGADAAFPALHGPFGEDGSVQGVLEWLDVPYVGSDVLASAVCMDKLTLKRLFAEAGLPQVEFAARRRAGLARALRGTRPAALGQALAARLERRHQQGREPRRGARARGRAGAAPRPAGDRRGLGARPRGRVLAARQRARSRPPSRARSSRTATGTTTRPSTATAAWS